MFLQFNHIIEQLRTTKAAAFGAPTLRGCEPCSTKRKTLQPSNPFDNPPSTASTHCGGVRNQKAKNTAGTPAVMLTCGRHTTWQCVLPHNTTAFSSCRMMTCEKFAVQDSDIKALIGGFQPSRFPQMKHSLDRHPQHNSQSAVPCGLRLDSVHSVQGTTPEFTNNPLAYVHQGTETVIVQWGSGLLHKVLCSHVLQP